MELYPIENYKALALAVVELAAKDYMRALRAINKYSEKLKTLAPTDKDYNPVITRIQLAKKKKYGCEKFFRSERFDLFINGAVEGEEFIRLLTRKALDPTFVIKEED